MIDVEERVRAWLPDRLDAAWTLAVRTVRDANDDRVIGLGAEAAFFALLALPPLVLVAVAAFNVFVDPATIESFVGSAVGAFVSADTLLLLFDVIERARAGSGGAISLGLVLGLVTASRATSVYLDAVSVAYDVDEPRSAVHRRLLGLGLTIGGLAAAVLLVPVLIAGDRMIAFIDNRVINTRLPDAIDLLFWPTVALVALVGLTTFYHLAVPVRTPWRRDVPGAVLAAVLWFLGAGALRAYLDYSIRGDDLYAPLATPLAVLLWLYLTAVAVLLGAELNAEIEKMWPASSTSLRDRLRWRREHQGGP